MPLEIMQGLELFPTVPAIMGDWIDVMLVVQVHPEGLGSGAGKVFTIFTIVGLNFQVHSLDMSIQVGRQKSLVVTQITFESGLGLEMHHF